MKKNNLNEIMAKFDIDAKLEEYGNGHINDTYIAPHSNYILQRINTNIFKNPKELMENIENVTLHLRKKIEAYGGNPDRETLTVIHTREGNNFYKVDDNNVFRLYKFIEDTVTIEDGSDLEVVKNAGYGYGRFQKLLSDFPIEKLHETIKDFHHTPKRVEALKQAVKDDLAGRAHLVTEEIEFALTQGEIFADVVVNGMENGEIPWRVTHNDTKINNILFDKNTKEAVCVIDLDTVMPGTALFDFGDALRFAGSTASEDETDLSKVNFSLDAFKAFATGFCSEVSDTLTKREKELLPLSVKLATYECGIRFLTDYLNGDTYFKIHRENHNLDRARNQFKLVRDMIEKEQQMKEIIDNL